MLRFNEDDTFRGVKLECSSGLLANPFINDSTSLHLCALLFGFNIWVFGLRALFSSNLNSLGLILLMSPLNVSARGLEGMGNGSDIQEFTNIPWFISVCSCER